MKARQLAAEFIRIFALDQAAFPAADVNLRAEQETEELPQDAAGADLYRPHTIVFDVSVTPLDQGGTILRYALNAMVESKPQDTTGEAHADLAEKVRRKFFGTAAADLATAKETMTAAMLSGGKFSLRGYDAGAGDAIDPSVENSLFRTVVPIRGIALLV
ncbi:MAG: hypothetical protein ABMA13_22185 [Chthoniobacteraceae bacterium]